MSKIFYDNLIEFQEIEVFIKNNSSSKEEKEELWGLVDGIIRHKIFDLILSNIHEKDHEGFLQKFHECPHDEKLLTHLSDLSGKDIEKIIKEESKKIEKELLAELKNG